MAGLDFFMSIVSGIISGVITFFAILGWTYWRKPEIIFSPKIAKRNNDGEVSYTFKFINNSMFPIANVAYKIFYSKKISYSEGNQRKTVNIKKGKHEFILPKLGKRIPVIEDDIENILKSHGSITIFVCYTSALFNIACRKSHKYGFSDVAHGIHESGGSLGIKIKSQNNGNPTPG